MAGQRNVWDLVNEKDGKCEECFSVPKLMHWTSLSIIKDAYELQKIVHTLPPRIIFYLARTAYLAGRFQALKVLISHWAYTELDFADLAPHVCTYCRKCKLGTKASGPVMLADILAGQFTDIALRTLQSGRASSSLRHLNLQELPPIQSRTLIKLCESITSKLGDGKNTNLPFTETFTLTLNVEPGSTEKEIVALEAAMNCCRDSDAKFRLEINGCRAQGFNTYQLSRLLNALPKSLIHLDLDYNRLERRGMTTVADSLSTFGYLRSLSLAYNNLQFVDDMEWGSSFGSLLGSFRHLQGLNLSYSPLRGALGTVLSHLQSPLTALILIGCKLSSFDLHSLRNSPHATSLHHLDVSGNNLRDSLSIILSLARIISPNLRTLGIRDCSLSPSDCETIIAVLGRVPEL